MICMVVFLFHLQKSAACLWGMVLSMLYVVKQIHLIIERSLTWNLNLPHIGI